MNRHTWQVGTRGRAVFEWLVSSAAVGLGSISAAWIHGINTHPNDWNPLHNSILGGGLLLAALLLGLGIFLRIPYNKTGAKPLAYTTGFVMAAAAIIYAQVVANNPSFDTALHESEGAYFSVSLLGTITAWIGASAAAVGDTATAPPAGP